MVCAYFRVGWTPTHGCCRMECARRFLIIMSNGINPCEAPLIRWLMNNLCLSINERSLTDQQSYHVSHLTVTLGIQFQTRFLLNRKVLIQGLCTRRSRRSDPARPFTWLCWTCKRNSSRFLDSRWLVTDWSIGSWQLDLSLVFIFTLHNYKIPLIPPLALSLLGFQEPLNSLITLNPQLLLTLSIPLSTQSITCPLILNPLSTLQSTTRDV